MNMVHYRFATEEQKELAMGARRILEKELAPQLEALEKSDNGLGSYPMDVHAKMADSGYYAMNVPEKWGGLGLDIVTRTLISEEMAQIDSGFTFSFINLGNNSSALLETTIPDDEKRALMERTVSGELKYCFCLTEAEAGSDAAAMRTTAVRDGNEWVINGSKCFASGAPNADFFVVAAWTDKTKRVSQGVTVFLVERDRGVTLGKKENKMGLKTSETSEVVFDNVRVPEDHVVGEVGTGFIKALNIISDEGRLTGLSYCLGIAQSALDHATEYAKTRRQFGKRIIEHQAVGFMLADMEARTQACRALLYEAVSCKRDGIDIGFLPNILKAYISDCTMQTTLDAVQIFGGYGYMKDYPVEKLMRDAKIFQIFSGTNQIQRKNAMTAIAGKDPMKLKK